MVPFLLATTATLVGAWRLARLLRPSGALLQLIAFGILVPIQVGALVMIVGGLFRTLHPGSLLIGFVLVATVEVLVARSPSRRDHGLTAREVARRITWSPATVALGVVVAAEYLWQALLTVRVPVFAYDALSYHLVSPGSWVTRGRVAPTGLSRFADSYPHGQEVLHAWTMTFFHSTTGTGMVVLWFVALGAACVAAIARSLGSIGGRTVGAQRSTAMLGGLLFAAIPAVFLQVSAAYVDVAGASVALAVLVLHAAVPRGQQPPDGPRRLPSLVLVGAALGYAIAVKESNLVLVPMVLGMVGWEGLKGKYRPWGDGANRPLPMRDLLATATPMAVVGAFWYVRNAIDHHNPFFPVSMLGLPGLGTFQGSIIGANQPPELRGLPFGILGTLGRSWIEDLHPHAYLYDQRLGGLGAGWVLLGLPCLVLVSVRAWGARRSIITGIVIPAVVLSLAPGAAWWARFSLPMAGVGCAAIAAQIGSLAGRRRARLGLTWATVLLAIAVVAVATVPTSAYLDGRAAGPAQLLAHGAAPESLNHLYPWAGYRGVRTIPRGSTVAIVAPDREPFPLVVMGTALTRRVVALDDPRTPGELVDQLRRAGAKYVILPPAAEPDDLTSRLAAEPGWVVPVAGGAGLDGSTLAKVAGHRPCPHPRLSLSGRRSPRRVVLRGSLVTRCGSDAHRSVQIWRADGTGDLWATAAVVATVTTDEAGRFSLVRPRSDAATDRYFARFAPKRRSDGRQATGGASAVITATS